MKYNIIFGKEKIDFFGTNEQRMNDLSIEIRNDQNNILSYNLNELPLTKKFIEKSFSYKKQYEKIKEYDGILYHYNHYPPLSDNFICIAKQNMNATIERLNDLGFNIDNSLKLNVNELTSEVHKLNDLHFIFESEQPRLMTVTGELTEELYLFEKINQLVHFLENIERSNKTNLQYLLVIRPANFTNRYKLQAEDYADFTVINSGDLVCDYATVGKDLYACYCTDDINLIKNNEVKQQEYLTDFVALHFRNYVDRDVEFKKYHDWCEKNKIDQYIDTTSPFYKPGRHILGHVDTDINNQEEFYQKIISQTPQVLGTYFSDDDGNIIEEFVLP